MALGQYPEPKFMFPRQKALRGSGYFSDIGYLSDLPVQPTAIKLTYKINTVLEDKFYEDEDCIGYFPVDEEAVIMEPIKVTCGSNNQVLVSTSSGPVWKEPGEKKQTEPVLYKCECCGATLPKDFKCEYCGTKHHAKEIK